MGLPDLIMVDIGLGRPHGHKDSYEVMGPESRRRRYVFNHPRWAHIVRTGLLLELVRRITEASPALDLQAFAVDVHVGIVIETHASQPLKPRAVEFLENMLDLMAYTEVPNWDAQGPHV